MVKNVGTADRVARIVIAGVLGFLTATPAINGWVAYVCLAIAAYLVITAIIGHCVIYDTLDVNSRDHGGTYHSGEDVYDGRGGN
jgi:DUF2892 family protein